MGELILCTHPTASKPYEVTESRINLYTIEELCYYLEESLSILEETFFTEKLCDWISQELDFPELADALWGLIFKKASVSECVRLIFRMSQCYLPQELNSVEQTLESMKGKSLLERKKIKIDYQLDNKVYSNCIREYEKMLVSEEADSMSDEFKGSLYHNLGVAYAGMFLFTEAASCFSKAYHLNGREESRACYFYALQFISPEHPMSEDDLGADFDALIRYKDDFNRIEAESALNGQRNIFQLAAEKRTSLEKRELLLNLIGDWKKKYRQI